MIQEPISDLKKILREPVEEVTAEHRAIPGATMTPDRRGAACLCPTDLHPSDLRPAADRRSAGLRPRLTVRLVALDDTRVQPAPLFSDPYSPAQNVDNLTPAPEGYDYEEDEEDDAWYETDPSLSLSTPEPGANSYPYTPLPNNDLWLNQYKIELPANRTRFSDPALPILLPTLSEVIESAAVTPEPVQRRGRRFFDPTLAMLTFLLLLGILGGIGFGYLLTLVTQ